MTKEELLAVKSHSRIKYIGSDPKVLEHIKQHGPANATTKGLIAVRIRDYTTSSWNKEEGLSISPWSGRTFINVKPEDWALVDDKRMDLTRKREQRNAAWTESAVRKELERFSTYFRDMASTKHLIDGWLDNVPLSARLKILTNLSADQKAWLQLLSTDPEIILAAIRKIAEDPEAEETNEQPELPNLPGEVTQSV